MDGWLGVVIMIALGVGFFLVLRLDVIAQLETPILPFLDGHRMMATHPMDGLKWTVSAALWIAVVLASPVILYQGWLFLAPALYVRERRLRIAALVGGVGLFALGAAFAFTVVLPMSLPLLFRLFGTALEPMITAEWAREIFGVAKRRGLITALVSDGNSTREALEYMRPVTDVFRVDLKTFDEAGYKSLGGRLGPVLESIALAKSLGYWVEVVMLVVPGFNDDARGLSRLADALIEIDPSIPWHVNGFVPRYKLRDRPAMPAPPLISLHCRWDGEACPGLQCCAHLGLEWMEHRLKDRPTGGWPRAGERSLQPVQHRQNRAAVPAHCGRWVLPRRARGARSCRPHKRTQCGHPERRRGA